MKAGELAGLAAAAGLGLGVAGCDGSAAALARRGSPQACTAPAVQSAVRDFVLPDAESPDHYSDNLKPRIAAADSALPHVVLSFDSTTLDAFDKDAGTVSCSTNFGAKLDSHTAPPVRWAYTVQPAAETGQVVIKSDDAAAHSAVMSVIRDYVDDKLGFHS